MGYEISSCKGLNGRRSEYATIEAAREAAREVYAELQPAWGVDISDEDGLTVETVEGHNEYERAAEARMDEDERAETDVLAEPEYDPANHTEDECRDFECPAHPAPKLLG